MMSRRWVGCTRWVAAVSVLGVVAAAACTLNPQPIPPQDLAAGGDGGGGGNEDAGISFSPPDNTQEDAGTDVDGGMGSDSMDGGDGGDSGDGGETIEDASDSG